MAKKAPKKGKPPAKKKTSKPAPKGKNGKKVGPRSQALPGMERVTDQLLNNLAESLGDIRAQQADLRADEAGNLQGAQKRMLQKGLSSYRFGKVEYLVSPGETKIRARIVKDTGTMAPPSDADENRDTAGEELVRETSDDLDNDANAGDED